MTGKRSYADGCAGAHALDLIGERWALLIVRELLLGPKRFTDLRAGLPGISPNVLSQRLDELADVGVVARRRLPPPTAVWVYGLTEWGRELETVVIELGRWGARSPQLPRDAALSAVSLMLSFRSMFDPAAAKGVDASCEFHFGEEHFHAIVADGTIEIARGAAAHPDVIVESDPSTIAALVYDGADAATAIGEGRLRLDGDRKAFQRFLRLFPLPAPAAPRAS